MEGSGGKRVAVIGAGASGIAAIKCCLDEGFIPVCLERTSDIGGLWNYTEDVKEGQACVMKSTVINTSKEIMCYSDFPIPKHYPNFMHNRKVLEYFRLYVENFKLKQYVRFNVEVLKLRQSEDFEETGKWDIELREGPDGEVRTETFDAVLVCTGHHADKNIASFPGEEEFEGKRVHTHDYKDHRGYEDKRVVVIGIGNSGGDVAVELSKIAKQVYLSTRRGSWVLYRVGRDGVPMDMLGLRRSTAAMHKFLPPSWMNTLIESDINSRFNHADYGLKPAHRALEAHPTVNDELSNRIICGSVVVKPNIKTITKTGIEFEDATYEDDIDAIIYATGYKFGFPFIDHPALEVSDNKVNLYKYIFPLDMKHQTLAVIGCVQPWGAIMPLSELQCRLACRVFKKAVTLPSSGAMWADIKEKQEAMAARYTRSDRHTIQVDWIDYLDQVAELAGCKPDIMHLWKTDPRLAFKVLFGPCTPYQYRLQGPGAWPGARKAIFSQWDRVFFPLRTRSVGTMKEAKGSFVMEILGILLLAWIIQTFLWYIV